MTKKLEKRHGATAVTEKISVVAVIATYRRPHVLERCLDSISRQTLAVTQVVVADNGAQEEVRRLVRERSHGYVSLEANRGCGAGLKAGEAEAVRQQSGLTHFWILDDDAVPPPETLERLLKKMEGSDLVAPLLADAEGRLWGFPEPVEEGQRREIRNCVTPGEALQKLGAGPHRLRWCTGACVLFSRRVWDELGPHRDDYWMLGEDHEFSMRVAAKFPAVFCCDVVVPHLPPEAQDRAEEELWQQLKFLALLQNLSYNGLRLPYGQGMARYLPGNFRRFFNTYGWGWRSWVAVGQAFLGGAVWGQPAGGRAGEKFRSTVIRRRGL